MVAWLALGVSLFTLVLTQVEGLVGRRRKSALMAPGEEVSAAIECAIGATRGGCGLNPSVMPGAEVLDELGPVPNGRGKGADLRELRAAADKLDEVCWKVYDSKLSYHLQAAAHSVTDLVFGLSETREPPLSPERLRQAGIDATNELGRARFRLREVQKRAKGWS